MKLIFTILLVASLFSLSSCSYDNRNSFAIRDFNKTLQPYLIKVVSKGIVGYDTATRFIKKHATDKELKQLSQSENPVLRALAFREMLDRPTFNHFDLMMNNLDDTAIVATDAGEWGISYLRVSDDMLEHGRWKDTMAKKKTIEEIILNHNFLSAAYYKLSLIEAKEAYYPSIKEMAQRERDFGDNFEQTEYAFYALAAYKKIEDTSMIKQELLSNIWRLSGISFGLMQEYPNETYLDIYEKFYPRSFYRIICRDQNIDNATSFISSIATYKNERSEKILSLILNRKPFMSCPADTNYLKRKLIYSIWNNPCNAYSKIRKQVEASIKKYEEQDKKYQDGPPLEVDTAIFLRDASPEPVRWW